MTRRRRGRRHDDLPLGDRLAVCLLGGVFGGALGVVLVHVCLPGLSGAASMLLIVPCPPVIILLVLRHAIGGLIGAVLGALWLRRVARP